MYKEIIICIIIAVVIILGNSLIENHTHKSVESLSNRLEDLRKDILKDEVDNSKAMEDINKIQDEWKTVHNNFAYFIQHVELEKVETEINSIESFLEVKNYEDSVSELDKVVFILKHIEERNKISLINIF